MQMKEKVKKEKKLRTPIQLNLKVNIGIIVTIVVAIFIAIPLLKGKEASKREALQIITESNLHKIIEVSQLSTYECVYNDVCTVMDKEDSSKIAYYCKSSNIKHGIYLVFVSNKAAEMDLLSEGDEVIDGVTVSTFIVVYDEEKDF